MIKATELRLGNWVKVGTIESTVCFIDKYHIQLQGNALINRPEQVEPIHLTPEILEKCGFKKDYNGFSLVDKMSLSFAVSKDDEYLACWLDRALGIIIKYLHQLQNIYFSLTGEELEIKRLQESLANK